MTPTRVSGIPYTQMPDGRLGNMFQIRIVNNTARNIQLAVESSAPSGTTLLCAQCNSQLPAFSEIVASAIVAFPRDAAGHTATIINRPTGDQIDVPLLGP